MFKPEFELIRRAVSGVVARDDVAAIAQHHRIQASPGYRAAAHYVLSELQAAGVDAQIEAFPANHRSSFWTAASFQEWDAAAATLHLVEPVEHARKLADFRELKISLIQRSTPFDGVAEVVALENGLDESAYEGLDLAGKVVLTRDNVQAVHRLAVEQHGAVGILFYGMRTVAPVREEMDLPDARQYTSFWWSDYPGEAKCFGFVLSPRQGRWLSALVQKREKDGLSPVQVRVKVESRLYDGVFEVVSAFIPGRVDQEVVAVAHLCHPQPSAIDNASGAAAALEIARALQGLIDRGDLPAPLRGIRFLWVPEMLGTYAYLDAHHDRIPSMIAGINLDMVGGDQTKNGSSFLLEMPPESASSFVPDLLERLRDELFDDAATHSGSGTYPLFRYATTAFSGGSDHFIFSDPTVGVPMAMLIQVPDRFYHTLADTVDKIDPAMLGRAGTLAAAFLYFIAQADQSKVTWLAYEMSARFQSGLVRQSQNVLSENWGSVPKGTLDHLERTVAYRLARFGEALTTLGHLWSGIDTLSADLVDEAKQFSASQLDRAKRALPSCRVARPSLPPEADSWEQRAAKLVPRRLYRGPADLRGHWAFVPSLEWADWFRLLISRPGHGWTLPALAEYWADGKRTALEIVDLVEMESGVRDAELIVKRYELLHKLQLMELDGSDSG